MVIVLLRLRERDVDQFDRHVDLVPLECPRSLDQSPDRLPVFRLDPAEVGHRAPRVSPRRRISWTSAS